MKRIALLLVLLVLAATGAFAQNSYGFGLHFDYSMGNGAEVSYSGLDVFEYTMNIPSFGAFIFYDGTYYEFSFGFAYGMVSMEFKDYYDLIDGDIKYSGGFLQLQLALLGKYPIDMGAISLFPLIGINYNYIASLAGDFKGQKEGDWSQIGFLGGLGVDYSLNTSTFLRIEAMFQLRLPNSYMNSEVKAAKDAGFDADTTFGMGPVIRAGVGFRW
jgi:opacity protein-like surface antigen